MISKIFISILIFSMAAGFSACTSVRSKPLKEVIFNDNNTDGEISITHEDLQPQQISNVTNDKTEQIQTLSDNSEIITKFDAYGNKIETRRFKSHSLVDIVIVRTSADNIKQIFVYGFGDVVPMPEDYASTAMSASADEIAKAGGLKTTRPFKSEFVTASPMPTPIPMQTPTQIRPVIQPTPQIQIAETTTEETKTEETEKPADEKQNKKPEQLAEKNL